MTITPSRTAPRYCCEGSRSSGSRAKPTATTGASTRPTVWRIRSNRLSVVVASNLNADILSDLGSALAGSLGLAASANLNPERRFPSMFEPVHGSAPDIAGQGLCNPVGAVGSAALMLDHLGLPEEAARIGRAIEATAREGVLTRDVGGTAKTEEVTRALIDNLGS
ncbi:isocitrate/isopropylmalate family dehydrogenase [Nocardiopsis coralli]|uniref:isocitrate/isopropylmalate family dehydrogenase n=1 Tax=Nocardiopsis coralli TaxID=2772213 RepID=UPI0038B3DEE7